MKPDFSTPGTLFLAAWVEDGQALIRGSMLNDCGDVLEDVVERSGPPWVALRDALADAAIAGPKLRLILMSNDETFVGQVRGQLPPAATHLERLWDAFSIAEQASTGRKGEWLSVPMGGDELQWDCLRRLGMWPGAWRAMVTADMPNVRERWLQQFRR